MYRMVEVSKDDTNFQRILWRENPSDQINHYRLTTVTYGTSCAPFLAIRTLHQIALDNKQQYPSACSIIQKSFYVDDLLTGADSIEEAVSLQYDLIKVLQSGGFHLRKWVSNCSSLSEDLTAGSIKIADDSSTVKILGLQWKPSQDMFSFRVFLPAENIFTKRQMLSELAKIYDPLGWLSPSTIIGKILLQKLWLLGLDLDAPLPSPLSGRWTRLRTELQHLENIEIPRWIDISNKDTQFHCFADASELAFAAAIYCRSLQEDGSIHISLITSATRVAPLKQISLPRLELCGALLVSRLLLKVIEAFELKQVSITAWSDSKVVLAWLADHPRRWSTFVGNRTAEILETIPRDNWRYIPSKSNPADIASRGIMPNELVSSDLWWHGPRWLHQNPSNWPQDTYSNKSYEIKEEEKRSFINTFSLQTENETLTSLVEAYSSWFKILRILAYCLRFVSRVRGSPIDSCAEFLSHEEFNSSRDILIKWVQHSAFKEELQSINSNKPISLKSRLITLTPFVDTAGVLRVGGRLQNSDLSFHQRHPIILPKEHRISHLIVESFHKLYLHPGTSVAMNIIRQQYWIISLRSLVKNYSNKCSTCFRSRRLSTQQLMGSLPHDRVSPSRPFSKTGVDYAGPILLLNHKGRGAKSIKGYISVFVCMVTKAVHLEIVSDLTTEAFIACLRRFISRRGYPTDIFSDNGTNFIGAHRKLSEFHALSLSNSHNKVVSNFLLDLGINWHFNPPSAPHFGGIWEAAVKSTKTHLRKVIGDTRLTFEEMATLLCQVESILNSRPLCPVSSDTADIDILTPAHFLVGDNLIALPEPYNETKISLSTRWILIQRLTQDFWKRWQRDYLTHLQQCQKWKYPKQNLEVNDIVIIKEEGPPCKWPLARVIDLHKGNDGLVRVVTLKTTNGTIKRPITKLCRLPFQED